MIRKSELTFDFVCLILFFLNCSSFGRDLVGGSRVELDGLVFRRAVPDHQVIHTKMTRHRRRVNIRTSYSFISKGEHHYSYSLISVPAPIADQILLVNGESTCTRAPSQLGCRACQRSRGGRGTASCSWHAGDWSNIFVVVIVSASTWTFLLLLLSSVDGCYKADLTSPSLSMLSPMATTKA